MNLWKIRDNHETFSPRKFLPLKYSSYLLTSGTRRHSLSSATDNSVYFFCVKPSSPESGELHLIQSFRLDLRVRRCANVLQYSILYTKLKNWWYDCLRCYVPSKLTSLFKKASPKQLKNQYTDDERKPRGMAFGSAVLFIEES